MTTFALTSRETIDLLTVADALWTPTVLIDVCHSPITARPRCANKSPYIHVDEFNELARRGVIPVLFCKKGITAKATAERLASEGAVLPPIYLDGPIAELEPYLYFHRFYGD